MALRRAMPCLMVRDAALAERDALGDEDFLELDIHRHAHELRLELHPHRILQIRMRAGGEMGDEEKQTREKARARDTAMERVLHAAEAGRGEAISPRRSQTKRTGVMMRKMMSNTAGMMSRRV